MATKSSNTESLFALSHRWNHLIVQPSDLRLNPPESYLFIQDGFIIFAGVSYALCYLFYIMRTYKDKAIAGNVLYLCTTMAWEIYYAMVTTSTTLERVCFFMWFLTDVSFATVGVTQAYAPEKRGVLARRLILGVLVSLAVLHGCCIYWPDEREQLTGYWTGLALQLPVGWGAVIHLLQQESTRGHSLEIWITRCLGIVSSYLVFFWRYWNVPQNWEYVGSWTSIAIIVLTLLPETVYPYVYLKVFKKEKKTKKH